MTRINITNNNNNKNNYKTTTTKTTITISGTIATKTLDGKWVTTIVITKPILSANFAANKAYSNSNNNNNNNNNNK